MAECGFLSVVGGDRASRQHPASVTGEVSAWAVGVAEAEPGDKGVREEECGPED